MATEDLVKAYLKLAKSGNAKAAKAFLAEHRADKRFVSLVQLREDFVAAFRSELDRRISASKAKIKAKKPVAMAAHG
jgi:hypothetical protein